MILLLLVVVTSCDMRRSSEVSESMVVGSWEINSISKLLGGNSEAPSYLILRADHSFELKNITACWPDFLYGCEGRVNTYVGKWKLMNSDNNNVIDLNPDGTNYFYGIDIVNRGSLCMFFYIGDPDEDNAIVLCKV